MKTTLAVALLLSTGNASIVLAQSGTFTATGVMITPHAQHTATLLLNGKVMIAGGYGLSGFNARSASAELFDPSSGVFTRTGDMSIGRAGHTATLLPDGRVLVCGGSTDLSAEIYDPSTGAFTATANMVARPYSWLSSTTLLQDGRVFVAAQPTAQLYDPVTSTFAATSPYAAPAPVNMERATLLGDGRVLLTGGSDTAAWSELYDPAADTFSLAGSMRSWDDVYTATLLLSGKVLFVGNEDGDGTPADAEVFDPAAGVFMSSQNASGNHEYGAAALLPDGSVLITGGQIPGGNGEVISELYAPSGTFSSAPNMITPRHEHTATLLGDGTVLIAGGFSVWPSPTANAELYRPAVLISGPSLFSLSGDGKGQGAIWHAATGQLASAATPAVAGEILSMYATSLADGGVIPPQVAIGGRLAEVVYFGASSYPDYNQVNFRVPGGVAGGASVPVRLIYLGRPSNAVTMTVQ